MRLRLAIGASFLLLGGWASAQSPISATATARLDVPRGVKTLPQVVVSLRNGVSPQLFAVRRGLTPVRAFASRPDTWVMAARSVAEATLAAAQDDPDVSRVYQDYSIPVVRRWEPNDPLYFPGTPTGANGQWHLNNANNLGGKNIDARLLGAWQRDWTGQGVVVGICDDGLEKNHADLSANFDAANSHDFENDDNDPSPVFSSDEHGTAVSGVVGARGGNGVGVTGAAPFVKLAGLRLPFETGTPASAFEDAIRYRSTGSAPTIQIKNHSYGFGLPYISDTPETAALADSIGAGTIHVWAAGNDRKQGQNRGENEDANKAATQAVPGQVVVAALGDNGVFSYYSSYGANVTVTAPSSSSSRGITTTDRTGSLGYNGLSGFNAYTNAFGGTSSASPLVAGILALVKQARPSLDGRFAKHLLATSSDKVDASDASASSDGGWRTNSAGVAFNQNYGFGMVNADRLTTNARLYSGVTALKTTDTGTVNVSATIPDNKAAGVSRTFTVNSTDPMEEAVVTINFTHPSEGDVQLFLTSPSGYKSRLLVKNGSDLEAVSRFNWTATTNAFWGENPKGTWKVTVADGFAGDIGTLHSFRVQTRNGSLNLDQTDDAGFVSQKTVPTTVAPGAVFQPFVTFKNTGTTTWTRDAGYVIRPINPNTPENWSLDKQVLRLTTAPGAEAQFRLTLTAPTKKGQYYFQWTMAKGTKTFGERSKRLLITVQ